MKEKNKAEKEENKNTEVKNKKAKKEKVENKKVNKEKVKHEKEIKDDKKRNLFSKSSTWITIAVIVIIVVAITVAIIFFLKSPRFAVMKTFNSMKKGDISSANKYISYDEVMDSLVIGLNVGNNTEEIEKKCFSDFKFKINKIDVNENTAKVQIETTNKNFRNALTKLTQQIYQKFINGEDISNEQGVTILNECLSDTSIGTMTVTKEITLNKENGQWKILIDNNLKDALFPGLSEVVNSIDALTTKE